METRKNKREDVIGKISAPNPIKLKAETKCSLCGSVHLLEMPRYATQTSFKCNTCLHTTSTSPEACCVFCEYSDTKCPPQQRRNLYFIQKENSASS